MMEETQEIEVEENLSLDDAVAALIQEEELADGQEDPGEDAEEAPSLPPIDPPDRWSEAEKAEFADLPPEVQQAVVRREMDRESYFRQQSDLIAQQRKEAEEALAEAAQKRDALLTQLQASPSIPEPDIAMLDPDSDAYAPDRYHLEKAKFDKAQKEHEESLQKLQKERDEEQSAQVAEWQTAQHAILQRELPELLDPTTGATFANVLAEYGQRYGITRDQLNIAAANEILLLNKARRFDELMEKAQGTQKRLKKIPKSVRPGTSQPTSETPKAQKIFDKRPTAESAAALLLERSGQRGTTN